MTLFLVSKMRDKAHSFASAGNRQAALECEQAADTIEALYEALEKVRRKVAGSAASPDRSLSEIEDIVGNALTKARGETA